MQDWQSKSKQMTKEMELLAPQRFGSENEMNQHNILVDYQENHLDSNLSAAKVDSDTVEIKQSEQFCDAPELAYSSAEESKEVIKNLHINTNDVLRKIETKNSKDEKEPIDLWLRNKCTKGVSKDENYIQLHQLSTDEFQGGERGTGITKNDEGDTDEVLIFSVETTKAEIGDQMQSIVYLRNAENTNVENSENSKKRKKPESKKSEDGEDPHLLKEVGKDETNIQLQQLNTDVFQGDETGTGITNNDEGDTYEVFVSEETEKKEIGAEKGGVFPLTNTGKNKVRSLPISDDFGELPIKERIKLMERKRFLKKYNSE
ncbi:unnamed protein product [Mytilus coruscus]|uniref:Uncharacterized protein n=1 Tax=Mytilus coruscus TaxID=42192 RepID=A0A6J8C5I9_MYTCO|nr:unnamed protein product [Mytilus coruscus]